MTFLPASRNRLRRACSRRDAALVTVQPGGAVGVGDAAGVSVHRRCDLCAAVGAEPVRVVVGHRSAMVDLCAGHSGELDALVAPYLAAAEQRGRPIGGSAFPRLLPGEDREAIRAWALAIGLPVARSGTISAAVLAGWREREPERVAP